MGDKINEYLLERLTFGDDDYYDIDYWDGLVYQSAKIKGSVIKAGILASVTSLNIYNTNGTLDQDRTLTGDFNKLFFRELGHFFVESKEVGIDNIVFEVNDNASNFGIVIRDWDSGLRLLATKDGKVEMSGAYYLPDVDGLLDQVMSTDGAGNLTWGASSNLYTADGIIGTNRTAQITDTLNITDGQIIRLSNGTYQVEVTDPSHLPSTLATDTTYIIIGTIDVSSTITVSNEGTSVVGLDRNRDCINWLGVEPTFLFDVIDVDFELSNLKITSGVADNAILQANNYNAGDYNNGRRKTLTIYNCQFRNCFDLIDVNGYDLVDISQCLIWYCQAQNFGMQFQSTSKLQFSSCEIIRWFNESSVLPPSVTPTGYAQVPMIDLRPNGGQSGFGAVNISGCIIHPQQTQDGLLIDALSTTGFGTISSNAFVTLGLTTGIVANFDYDVQKTFDIFANQGIFNSVAYILTTFQNNTNDTDLNTGTPAPVENGSIAVVQNSQRFTMANGTIGASINNTCIVTYEGTKDIYVSLTISLSYDKQGGGTDPYIFSLHKDTGGLGTYVEIAGSSIEINAPSDHSQEMGISLVCSVFLSEDDKLAVFCENPTSGDDILVKDFQWLIKE